MFNWRNCWRLVALVFLLLITGCGKIILSASEYTEMAIQNSSYKGNRAVVYFMQPERYGAGLLLEIFLNDLSIGILDSHTFFPKCLKPGTYTIWARRAGNKYDKKVPITLKVEANANYYITAKFEWSHVKLTELNKIHGVKDMAKCELSGVPSHIHMIITKHKKSNEELASTIQFLSTISDDMDGQFKALEDVYVGKLLGHPDFCYTIISKALSGGNRLWFLKSGMLNMPPGSSAKIADFPFGARQLPFVAELNGEQIFSMENNYFFVDIDGYILAINKDLVTYYQIDPPANIEKVVHEIGNQTTTIELIGKNYRINPKVVSQCKLLNNQHLLGFEEESLNLYELTLSTKENDNNFLNFSYLPLYQYVSLSYRYTVVDTYEQFMRALTNTED